VNVFLTFHFHIFLLFLHGYYSLLLFRMLIFNVWARRWLYIYQLLCLIVEVRILHVPQSGLGLESTSLSVNGGILGKDARVVKFQQVEISKHE